MTMTQTATPNASLEANDITGVRWVDGGDQWVDLMIDALSPDELMLIYMEAWGGNEDDSDWDEIPPIVAARCPECYMMLEDFTEHHCIRR